MTTGSPPSTTATTEFVVPRSMPITFAMSCSLLSRCLGLRVPGGPERDRPGPPTRGSGVLGRLDLDLLGLDLLDLGEFDGQNPGTIRRLHLVGLDGNRQRERALELPEPTLPTVVTAVLRLGVALTLTLDGEQIAGDGHPDIRLAEPGQLGRDDYLVLGLVHVDCGTPQTLHPGGSGMPEDVVEQAVHVRLEVR